MAAVRIVRDPIASDTAAEVPKAQWDVLMEARRLFCTQYLPKDCRNLLYFIEDGAANNWVGYSCADAYIRGGLGLDPEMVDWAIAGLRQMRPETEIGFEVAAFIGKLGTHGGAHNLRGINQHTAISLRDAALSDGARGGQGDNVTLTKRGNKAAYAFARLERDRPDLAQRVRAKELSPHAAAIEAGFRIRTIAVPADPEGAVAALIRRFGRAVVLAAIERKR